VTRPAGRARSHGVVGSFAWRTDHSRTEAQRVSDMGCTIPSRGMPLPFYNRVVTKERQSISSTRGSPLLHAFLDQVHRYHKTPSSYPPLHSSITAACAYRTSAASSSQTTLPTPPMTPPATSSSSLLHGLRLVENQFGNDGLHLKTQDVFEALVRSRKGKEKAIGDVWLDGETVRGLDVLFVRVLIVFSQADRRRLPSARHLFC
jgi:hypothetical protein